MKKLILILIIIFSLVSFSHITWADVGSTELIEKGKEYDGQTVTFTGEVIGDPMSRRTYIWLNVKDKDNTMGIWVKKDLLPKIKHYGFYRSIGDTLVIQGTIHRSCIEHGGDMDIHAVAITVLKVGHPVKHRVRTHQLIMAVISLFTAGLAFFLYRLKKKSVKSDRSAPSE